MIVVADTSPLTIWCSSDISISWRKYTPRFSYREASLMSFTIATHLQRFARGFRHPRSGYKSALSSSG
jgi:hypothetical protein